MDQAKPNEQTISKLPALNEMRLPSCALLAQQEDLMLHYKWMSNENIGNLVNRIDMLAKFCYNVFTFPSIFRDGVRGGYAASAVLIGG